MDNMTTGQRIAECRKKLGLSQEGLGEKVGVSRQAISKWEADAAMPDIDKLISLSRLFSVSVGWLLGVEELPQPETPQVSEELLHKIEAVVQQYQPRKKHSPWKIAAGIVIAALLIWGGVNLGREWQYTRSQVSYLSGQLQSTRQQNNSILIQLDDLAERIDSLNSAPENFSISGHSFQIEPDNESANALVTLSVVPGRLNGDYTVSISVRRDGQQVVSQACAWDGSGFTARLLLPLENGYEYWFTAEYPSGAQEQVQLLDSAAENLKSSFTIQCDIKHGTEIFKLKSGTMELDGYEFHLVRPNLTSGHDVDWASTDLVLYHIRGSDRQVADTYMLFDQVAHKEEQSAGQASEIREIWYYPNGPFRLPELQEGDGLELWVSAEMSNGISLMEMVDSWAYLDGEFISGVPVE